MLEKKLFVFLLIFFFGLSIFWGASKAANISPEEIGNYLSLSRQEIQAFINSLLEKFTIGWMDLITSSRDVATEEAIMVLARKAVREKILIYIFVDLPLEAGKILLTAIYKVAVFIYSPEKASQLIGEFEKLTVEKAKEYALNWLFQKEIKVGTGNLSLSYTTCEKKRVDTFLPYIITLRPLDAKQFEAGMEIYSARSLKAPLSEGNPWSIIFNNFWFGEEDKDLPPFVLRLKGIIEKKDSGYYHWLKDPEIKTEFPEKVPDLNFPEPSFIEKIKQDLKERFDSLEKILSVLRNLGKKAGEKEEINIFDPDFLSGSLITPPKEELEESPSEGGGQEEEEALVEEPTKEQKSDESAKEKPISSSLAQNSSSLSEIERQINEITQKIALLSQETSEFINSSTGAKVLGETSEEEGQELIDEEARPLENILISEVCAGLDSAGNEFIELYNPNEYPVSLSDSNFYLDLVSSSNKRSEKEIIWLRKIIPAKGYFLLAGGELVINGQKMTPDASFSSQLTSTSGAIIKREDESVLDRVAWAKTGENPPVSAVETQGLVIDGGLKTGKSLERREINSAFRDTNNNSQDFILSDRPSPTNSLGQKMIYTLFAAQESSASQNSGGGGGQNQESEAVPRVLITEVQIEGNKDFVEIYNPLTSSQNLSGCKLRKKTQGGTEYSLRSFPESTIIGAGNYLLWATTKDDYHLIINADLSSSGYLGEDNSLAIFDKNSGLIDAVAWGNEHINPFKENLVFPENPRENQSLGRKWIEESQTYQDINDNSLDFELQFPTPKTKNRVFQDETAPETIINSHPEKLTNENLAIFSFSSSKEASTFECRLDNNSWQTCISPQEYSEVSDGSHLFEARAIDKNQNIDFTPAQYQWEVDTTSPLTEIILKPESLTNMESASFVFESSEENCSFNCRLDNGDWQECQSPQIYSAFSQGSHFFEVKAKDLAENWELIPVSCSWTIDSSIKTPQLLLRDLESDSPVYTKERIVKAEISNDDEAVFWLLSENENEADDSGANWQTPRPAHVGLSCEDGLKIVYLWLKDEAGNKSEKTSTSIILDTQPPLVSFSDLAPIQNQSTFPLNWQGQDEGSGISHYCLMAKEEGEAWPSDCLIVTSQSYEFSGENNKTYYFKIKAIDKAGNESEWSEEISTKIIETAIQVFPRKLEFKAIEFGENPPSQKIKVEAAGLESLSWEITDLEDDEWLEVSPRKGETPAETLVSIDIADLEVGIFTAEFGVFSQGEIISIEVILEIAEDTFPPSPPVVTSHTQGQILESSQTILAGTAEANNLILINSDQTESDENGNWQKELTLIGGENIFLLSAEDKAGNKSEIVTFILVLKVGEEPEEPEEPSLCVWDGAAAPTHSPIIINEVAWMGGIASSSDEWIELKNISSETVSLENWQLFDKDSNIAVIFNSSDSIAPREFYLLERTDDNSVPGISADKIYTGALNNQNESLLLFNQNCGLVDEVQAAPNWPAGNNAEKRTMERLLDLGWQTYKGEARNGIWGTPKAENSKEEIVIEPEPEAFFWSQAQKDAQRRGFVPVPGPETTDNVRIVLEAPVGDMIITEKGTIFFNDGEGIHRLDKDFKEEWFFREEAIVSLAGSEDGTIFSLSWKLVAVNQSGRKLWEYEFSCSYAEIELSVFQNHVYVLNKCLDETGLSLFSFSSAGKLEWIFDTLTGNVYREPSFSCRLGGGSSGEYISSPAVGSDGTIYFGDQENFYAVTSDGNLKWKRDFSPLVYRISASSVGLDGKVYVIAEKLLALDPLNGETVWSFAETGRRGEFGPSFGDDGTVYAWGWSFSGARLYALNPSNGQIIWGIDPDWFDNPVTLSGLTITQNSILLAANRITNSQIRALNFSSGFSTLAEKEIWSFFPVMGPIFRHLPVSPSGTLFLAAGKLVAISP